MVIASSILSCKSDWISLWKLRFVEVIAANQHGLPRFALLRQAGLKAALNPD
jgi:hypothetical protein